MFKAIIRWFKSLGYLLTGKIDDSTRGLSTNPHALRAQYDAIVKDKISRIQQYKQAVAGIIAQQENKMSKLKQLTEDVERLERLKAGALAKAKQLVDRLQAAGRSKEEIHADEEYKKCLAAYKDFSSTLKEKQDHITDLESDVEGYRRTIGDHKAQMQQLIREVDKVKAEAADAVAEIITAKQEKEIADTLSGIAEDGSGEELRRLREVRQEVRAESRISREMAGLESRSQESEFLAYAERSAASDEFDALIGIGGETDAAPRREESGDRSPLPE